MGKRKSSTVWSRRDAPRNRKAEKLLPADLSDLATFSISEAFKINKCRGRTKYIYNIYNSYRILDFL